MTFEVLRLEGLEGLKGLTRLTYPFLQNSIKISGFGRIGVFEVFEKFNNPFLQITNLQFY